LAQAALAEFRLARERRLVLPRAEIIRQLSSFLGTLKTRLLALPGQFVRSGVCPPETASAIDAGIRQGLEELVAAWSEETDLLEAAPRDQDDPVESGSPENTDDEPEP
jgi:hypothetical protein